MKAYHNDPKIKDKYVNRMKGHITADEVIQGTGYDNGMGCAVGCTLNKYEHKSFEDELGIPEGIAHLFEYLFEAKPDRESAAKFSLDVLEAIPVGADLSLFISKFNLWLLKDKEHGVYQYADADGKKAINGVTKLLRRQIKGVKVRKSSWYTAARAAAEAAADAYDSYTYAAAAAADTAAAAAYSAARAARDAGVADWGTAAEASCAADYADNACTADAAREIQANKFLELLRSA